MSVLVVDDQRSVRMVAAAELAAAGHHVLEAEDGMQALDLFRRARPDLVLMDVEMPRHDGYAVARQMRAAEGDNWTPIVFLSSHADDNDLFRGIEAGGDDYLSKPLRPVVLRAKLMAMQRLQVMRRKLVAMGDELAMHNERLKLLTHTDGLTGLLNRRAFDEQLALEIAAAAREGKPLTLLLCDVDHFKKFNDHAGHPAGDACLQHVGKLLKTYCRRPRDAAARYGGEEFALILPHTPKSGAMMFAKTMVRAMKDNPVAHPASTAAEWVTVSGGVVTYEPAEGVPPPTPAALIACADAALYQAKERGRNRFFSHELQVDTTDGVVLQPAAATA